MATRHDNDPKALVAARSREAKKPGRHKANGRGSGLTPRIRLAIEILVFGHAGKSVSSFKEAAEAADISVSALHAALLKPSVDTFYQQQMISLRNGERAASIRTIAEIRDDVGLKSTAAGQNVRLKAAERLAFDPPGQQVTVNTLVTLNNQQVTPGYVIDLDRGRKDRLARLERLVEVNGIHVPADEISIADDD